MFNAFYFDVKVRSSKNSHQMKLKVSILQAYPNDRYNFLNLRMISDNFNPLFSFLKLFNPISLKDEETICENITLDSVKEGTILLKEGKIA